MSEQEPIAPELTSDQLKAMLQESETRSAELHKTLEETRESFAKQHAEAAVSELARREETDDLKQRLAETTNTLVRMNEYVKFYAFVFIDKTTNATPDNLRPAQALDAIVLALVEQLSTDYARAYGPRTIHFRIASGPDDRAPGEIAINLRDTMPEAPGALADHQDTNGIADVEVACSLFSTLTDGAESFSVGVSHEILELLGDEGANGWKDRQDPSGLSDAEELCDFVQNTSKPMSNGVHVSNFVLPSFFIPGATGPWDNQGVMTSQRDITNGYGIVATSPTDAHQLLGGRAKAAARELTIRGSLSVQQKARKGHPYSRTYRRGVRF